MPEYDVIRKYDDLQLARVMRVINALPEDEWMVSTDILDIANAGLNPKKREEWLRRVTAPMLCNMSATTGDFIGSSYGYKLLYNCTDREIQDFAMGMRRRGRGLDIHVGLVLRKSSEMERDGTGVEEKWGHLADRDYVWL